MKWATSTCMRSTTVQCHSCSKHLSVGLTFISCGGCLRPDEETKKRIKARFPVFIVPYYLARVNRSGGKKHGGDTLPLPKKGATNPDGRVRAKIRVEAALGAQLKGEIAALMTAMTQVGVGSQGGGEAHAIFHQLSFDDWATRSLVALQARIKVDGKNCFGMIEGNAVRNSASSLLSKHAAVAGWKHRALSFVD